MLIQALLRLDLEYLRMIYTSIYHIFRKGLLPLLRHEAHKGLQDAVAHRLDSKERPSELLPSSLVRAFELLRC